MLVQKVLQRPFSQLSELTLKPNPRERERGTVRCDIDVGAIVRTRERERGIMEKDKWTSVEHGEVESYIFPIGHSSPHGDTSSSYNLLLRSYT